MSRPGFLSAALADIRDAYEWYEEQRPGLGEEFVGAVDAATDSILEFPDAYPAVHRDARRYLVERFPYCIYYRIDSGDVIIVACMHAARDPRHWRSRLRR